MGKETAKLKCFGCYADFTVSAKNVHTVVRNASAVGTHKLRCPLCGSFLYPKEFEPTEGCTVPDREAFRYSACPMAGYCNDNDNPISPECEEGRVSKGCMRAVFQRFEHVEDLFAQALRGTER